MQPRHFAVGKIKFSEKHLRTLALARNGTGSGLTHDAFKREGIIVYVKPSVIPNAPAEVRGYGYAFGLKSEGLENRGRISMKKIQLFFGMHVRAHND